MQLDNDNQKIILYNVFMDFLENYLFYINIFLLMSGATCIFLGGGFLRREKNTSGFF